MIIIENLHSNIHLFINYFGHKDVSYQDLANTEGVSREAIRKRISNVYAYLLNYSPAPSTSRKYSEVEAENNKLRKEIDQKNCLMKKLQLQLVLHATTIFILTCFKEYVQKWCPRFKLTRYKADQKLQILNLFWKFKKMGGTAKEFCKSLGKSTATLKGWEELYKKYGITGLHDKTSRPKTFGNKITPRLKNYLLALFIRFPRWSPYQYHKHLRFSPEVGYYVSLPTIQKLKTIHQVRSEVEKERLLKRWCFDKGVDVWTIDFTCIQKTDHYKLQLLTVSDARSRFLFNSPLLLETSTGLIFKHLLELFAKYGRPTIIKADNGPEFRTDCEKQVRDLSVYLFNNPVYYGQFNGAHERIHRTLKTYIDKFECHKNLTKLVAEINSFEDEYNYLMKQEYLEKRTPADVYFNDKEFVPKNCEIVKPYEKDGEMRMKFTDRYGDQARMSLPLLE